MKICLVGGIYGKGGVHSQYVKITPETTLENGFREAGHEVTTLSHYDEANFNEFDVVHVHHLSFGALRMAGDSSATPFVFTPHSTTHLTAGSMSRVRLLSMRLTLSSADAIVNLSNAEVAQTREAFALDPTILTAIPNGVDIRKYSFRRDNRAGQGSPWQILFVGQLIPLKRCDVLLRAIARIPHAAELTLVYQNPLLERELMALAASLGLSGRVHFRGGATPEELAKFYQASDLFVLPSETEALPSVITEAMMCGLPFVASAVGGIREQANGFGVALEDRSTESLAESIAEVFDHYDRYQAEGAAMSQYAQRTYSIDTMVTRHLELYERLQGLRPRRHASKRWAGRVIARMAARWMGTSGPPKPNTFLSNEVVETR